MIVRGVGVSFGAGAVMTGRLSEAGREVGRG